MQIGLVFVCFQFYFFLKLFFCPQMTSMVQGIFDQYQLPKQEYFVGLSFYPNATGVSKRNWESIKYMDS